MSIATSAFKTVRTALSRFAVSLAGRSRPDFICGDCDRWERCGLPPGTNCIARAAQIEQREREGYRPRHAGYALPFRPPFDLSDRRR